MLGQKPIVSMYRSEGLQVLDMHGCCGGPSDDRHQKEELSMCRKEGTEG